ncbi:MAG: hypothetical protein A3K76_01335 [Euryarchaeota archaeon RBG_13_57_23]|nr:MAG: hypothetical protein A3K76_01335 [Euryarchaeota archaeon RBG_13_57_23]
MAYEDPEASIDEIRRRYTLIALAGLSGDIVILSVLWLMSAYPQNILIILTVSILAGGFALLYLLAKVAPDRIAKSRGLT